MKQFVLFDQFLRRVRRGAYVRRKNARINRNVRDFMERAAPASRSARETRFLPEVLIPCYNHGRYIEAAIESVPAGCPITVVDDASTDDTPEIIRTLSTRFAFKSLRNTSNRLQTGSLNRGVTESENNLFVVLNADDCLLPYALNTIVQQFALSATLRMVGGGAIPFSGDATRRLLRSLPTTLGYLPRLEIFNASAALGYHQLNDINMSMSGCAFLRSAWEGVGGFLDFSERVCSYDDRDFQMRVSCLFDVGVMEEPLCLYRVSSSLGRAQFTE